MANKNEKNNGQLFPGLKARKTDDYRNKTAVNETSKLSIERLGNN